MVLQEAFTLVVAACTLYFLHKYFKGGVCRNKDRLDGKTVVITGCNTGIGLETALELAKRGARIIMACRNLEKAFESANYIKKQAKNAILSVHHLELASLDSVRKFAREIIIKEDRIDILINNAGIMNCPFMKTKDGFEMQIGVNHFGHFLLTNLLLDKIKASAPSRIINVASSAHELGKIDLTDINFEKRKYNRFSAYNQSKLANILFTKELAKRLEGTGVTCYSLHPGLVRTELDRHLNVFLGPIKYIFWSMRYFFTKNSWEGAQTTIYCAVDESLALETGKYYSDCKEKEPIGLAKDPELAAKLWDLSAKAVDL